MTLQKENIKFRTASILNAWQSQRLKAGLRTVLCAQKLKFTFSDVVHKETCESLERRGKPFAASAYNLNLTHQTSSVGGGLAQENDSDTQHLMLTARRSCHDISTPRTSSEKAVSSLAFFSTCPCVEAVIGSFGCIAEVISRRDGWFGRSWRRRKW